MIFPDINQSFYVFSFSSESKMRAFYLEMDYEAHDNHNSLPPPLLFDYVLNHSDDSSNNTIRLWVSKEEKKTYSDPEV